MPDDERLLRLEERLSWLQRHLVEQDREMLKMGAAIGTLKRELAALRERATDARQGNPMPADEKPPHY
jgi:SlyX protein